MCDETASTSRWHHAPVHYFVPNCLYMITSATYLKQRLFDNAHKLDHLEQAIFEAANDFGWELHAWAVFSNHYHLIAKSPRDGKLLVPMLRSLHSKSAIQLNKSDGTPGRRIWYRYWDTCLTYQASYLARLNYVHLNPVKHGLVNNPEMYKWCSVAWFKQTAPSNFQRSVSSFKVDRVNVLDDFD